MKTISIIATIISPNTNMNNIVPDENNTIIVVMIINSAINNIVKVIIL